MPLFVQKDEWDEQTEIKLLFSQPLAWDEHVSWPNLIQRLRSIKYMGSEYWGLGLRVLSIGFCSF